MALLGETVELAMGFQMPRFCQRRYILPIAAGLAACGTIWLGLDGGGLRAANGSASFSCQQVKLCSDILGRAGARLELADAAETKPIAAKNGGRMQRSSKAARGGRALDRSQAPQKKAGTEEDSAFDIRVTPSWMHKKTPAVGSPEYEQEQRETEKQEREVRRAIEGICRGC
jgi:hypothetical protein